MASSHQRAYYILQPITETNGSEQPNYILKCLKFMLRLYSNFAFHQQMAILSYSISFTKEFIVFIDTVKSQFPSPSPPSAVFLLYRIQTCLSSTPPTLLLIHCSRVWGYAPIHLAIIFSVLQAAGHLSVLEVH